MGYKAMAEKFRQAVGLADPYPAALALDGLKSSSPNDGAANYQNTVRKDDERERKSAGVEARAAREMACRKARRKAEEMLKECRKSQRGVRIALAIRLSPDLVPPEVEREEWRRQGLPARDGLASRFVEMMA